MGTALLLGACSQFPVSGPADTSITQEASAGVSVDQTGVGYKYALVDLSESILPFVSEDPSTFAGTFGLGRAPSPEVKIGIGDVVAVTIFESSAGGLFIPNDAGSRPGNYVTLPNQTVDKTGNITVPYAGPIPFLGKTQGQVQKLIEEKLASRAIEPQAVVTLVTQHSSDVSVIGAVNSAGRFTVSAGGERVLDLLAQAGGLKKEPYQTTVTLQRGDRTATIDFNSLVGSPTENIYVTPGDTVYVFAEAKSFVALGATGANQRVEFSAQREVLTDAVGQAGGLLDDRANPAQTFIYRMEQRSRLQKMGVDLKPFGNAKEIPTVYRANLRDPASFFAARSFPMRDKDVLYVSNAASVELVKVLSVVNSVTNTAANTGGNAVTTRDAGYQLGRGAHQ